MRERGSETRKTRNTDLSNRDLKTYRPTRKKYKSRGEFKEEGNPPEEIGRLYYTGSREDKDNLLGGLKEL